MQFKDFVDQLEPLCEQLSLPVAIECVMAHSNKGVLLLIDEIMKSGGGSEDTKLINQRVSDIGSCLDTLTTQFNAVLTTLNIIVTTNATKPSGRPVSWIPLPPATLSEATSLFGRDTVKYPILRLCIADCNGHHRSLETLKMVWNEYRDVQFSYAMLIEELGRRVDQKYRQLTLDLIRPALKGYTVALTDSPDGIHTFAEYLAQGYYLNTPEDVQDFIPRVSPLQLIMYALDKVRREPSSVVCLPPSLSLFFLNSLLFALRMADVQRQSYPYLNLSGILPGSNMRSSTPIGKFCTGIGCRNI